ncbi:MAG: biotin--[acetyl-CoA-carboxylase] ligase [Xanthomonadaceae bacterium]|nr:biotin--[acetyl-CoA-carboxylase] ligase [Xanthomonadaceae bacterium]
MFDTDTLDADAIAQALSPNALGALAALEVVASIDSTNSELLRRDTARIGACVLFAEHQTGGRGRQGRVWVSPPACNLYVSIARHFVGPVSRLGGLSIAVGVATAEALRALGLDTVGLKWPNDVVIADGARLRKLGGILIESGGGRDGAVRAIIGLGLNVRMSERSMSERSISQPADVRSAPAIDPHADIAAIDQPWTDLRTHLGARTPSRNVIAAALLDALLPALDLFDRDGLDDAIARYARYDALRGRAVTWEDGAQGGIADGLDDDGALRVRTSDGATRALRAGEVRVRPRDDALPYRP